MAGAIAGTAILNNLNLTNRLRTITLTINNNCNLNCPHCYLQYDRKNFIVEEPTINSIFKAEFEHLAIVGKEPFVNKYSVELLENLIERCFLNGKTISVITNGIGLTKLNPTFIKYLDYIDVSFDGGPLTYKNYRKGDFFKIIDSINQVASNSNIRINALHTISSATIENIDDMMAIKQYAKFGIIMFSPFLDTLNDGIFKVSVISIEDILKKLSQSDSFMYTEDAFLLLDTYHATQEGVSIGQLNNLIDKYSLKTKIKLIEKDPLNYGIIRVTFDDFVLTPYESIHTQNYHKSNFVASSTNLNQVFQVMQNSTI